MRAGSLSSTFFFLIPQIGAVNDRGARVVKNIVRKMLNDRHATSRLVQSLMSSEGDARKNAPLFAEISICSGTTPSTIPSPGWINVPLHEFPFIVENENEITRFTPDPSNTAARVAIGFPFSRQSSAEVRNDSPNSRDFSKRVSN
jgi:hypothetical protein